jgi:hypothetical protein
MKITIALLLLFCLIFPLLVACRGGDTPPAPPAPDPNEIYGEGEALAGTGASLPEEFIPQSTTNEDVTFTQEESRRIYRNMAFLGTVTVAEGADGITVVRSVTVRHRGRLVFERKDRERITEKGWILPIK